MKLRNKETGEIGKLHCDMNVSPAKYGVFEDTDIRGHYWEYDSLSELNKDWEDYEEPKEHWAIDQFGEPINVTGLSRLQLEKLRRYGNDFPSENATIEAIEKLKAWTRLKDKGFRFTFVSAALPTTPPLAGWIDYEIEPSKGCIDKETIEDLDLLFGGENE